MKTLRTIIAGLALIIAMMSAPQISAQTVSTDMKKAVMVEMQKQLPMEVSTGMTWTKFTYDPGYTTMTWVFRINPKQMGTTLREAKEEMNGYTNRDIKALLGDDVQEVLDMLQSNCRIVFTFPDGTSKQYFIKR